MGEFVDQRQRGAAGEDRVEVHLLERLLAVGDPAPGDDLEAADEGGGLGAAVGLDDADHHVDAVAAQRLAGGQHLPGLADAGGGAEEDLQPPAGLADGLIEQGVGRGTRLGVSAVVGHAVIPRPCCSGGGGGVKREVEGEDVDPRLAEEAERPALGVGRDEGGDLVRRAGRGRRRRAAPGRRRPRARCAGRGRRRRW